MRIVRGCIEYTVRLKTAGSKYLLIYGGKAKIRKMLASCIFKYYMLTGFSSCITWLRAKPHALCLTHSLLFEKHEIERSREMWLATWRDMKQILRICIFSGGWISILFGIRQSMYVLHR